MKKFDYKKWVTDYKNGKPLFEAQKDDKDKEEEEYFVMNTADTNSYVFSKRTEAVDFVWTKLKKLVDNKSIEEPDYRYYIQFDNDDSISVVKRYLNYVISYDNNVVTYYIRKVKCVENADLNN